MMRLVLVLFATGVFLGCEKSTVEKTDPALTDTMKFEILPLPDTFMKQTDSVLIPIFIRHLYGRKERVILSVSGLPVSMSAGFIQNPDTPDFYSGLHLFSHHTDTGSYAITLIASSGVRSVERSFHVAVLSDPPDPFAGLKGSYRETGQCTSRPVDDTVTVSINSIGEIIFKGLWAGGSTTTVSGTADPLQKKITLPLQPFNDIYFVGMGTYSSGKIELEYLIGDGNVFEQCHTVLIHL